jgi:NAD(P)-dependent dehydrogenase (short-subunit alcohol dehydrogenase family)
MNTLNGTELDGRDTLVLGGTGNVGFYLVDGFLRAGSARVLVPSRSPGKIEQLRARIGASRADRIVAVPGDIGSADGAALLQHHVAEITDDLRAVASAPASWHQNSSMLRAGFADFTHVIETRLYPHFLAAEAFLPLLTPDGAYTTINGPAGFSGPPQRGVGAISVAAAAQGKLIQAFAMETGGRPRVNDIIMWAFISPQGTRPGSPLAGEQVGDFVAALSSDLGTDVHARTIPLRRPVQVEDALAGRFPSDS